MKNKLNKRGISLIVLVITIIIMIILAAAVILSLNTSGIISRANKAKNASDLQSLKEAYAVVESENILKQTNNTKTEMLLLAAEKCNLQRDFTTDGIMYTGLNSDIKVWVVENFVLDDIAEKGYLIGSAGGTVYITGVEVEGRSITSKTANDILSIEVNEQPKYAIYDNNKNSLIDMSEDDRIVGTDYTVKIGDDEVAKILVYGDVDGNGLIQVNDATAIFDYVKRKRIR